MPSMVDVAHDLLKNKNSAFAEVSIPFGIKRFRGIIPLSDGYSATALFSDIIAKNDMIRGLDQTDLYLWMTEGFGVTGSPSIGWPIADYKYGNTDELWQDHLNGRPGNDLQGVPSYRFHEKGPTFMNWNNRETPSISTWWEYEMFESNVLTGNYGKAYCGEVSIKSTAPQNIENALLIQHPTVQNRYRVYDVNVLIQLNCKVLCQTGFITTSITPYVAGGILETTSSEVQKYYSKPFVGHVTFNPGAGFNTRNLYYHKADVFAGFADLDTYEHKIPQRTNLNYQLKAWQGSLIAKLPVVGIPNGVFAARREENSVQPASTVVTGDIALWKKIFPEQAADLDQLSSISCRYYDKDLWIDYSDVTPIKGYDRDIWEGTDVGELKLGSIVDTANKIVSQRKPMRIFAAANPKGVEKGKITISYDRITVVLEDGTTELFQWRVDENDTYDTARQKVEDAYIAADEWLESNGEEEDADVSLDESSYSDYIDKHNEQMLIERSKTTYVEDTPAMVAAAKIANLYTALWSYIRDFAVDFNSDIEYSLGIGHALCYNSGESKQFNHATFTGLSDMLVDEMGQFSKPFLHVHYTGTFENDLDDIENTLSKTGWSVSYDKYERNPDEPA